MSDGVELMLRAIVRRLAPDWVLFGYRAQRLRTVHRRFANMTTEQAFTEIYATNLWGGEHGTFRSGDGSAREELVRPYVETMKSEFGRIGAQNMTVVDLGCGDFEVGRRLAPLCRCYVGVDIVRPLIDRNRARYGDDRVSFEHLDIVQEEPPQGDVCLVRQVLQHLSNRQIAAVLPKLARYRYCYVTEHHPSADSFSGPNIDKPQGPDNRIPCGSGVFLEEPPFSLPRDRYKLILEAYGHPNEMRIDPGVIRTFRLSSDASRS